MVMIVFETCIMLMMMIVMIFNQSLFGFQKTANLWENIQIGCDMKIHQRLDNFFTKFGFLHLHRNQRIDMYQTQIQAIRTYGSEEGILSWIMITQNIRRITRRIIGIG